ncbi:hypothetical protein AYO43_00105 [Nitrospira sp. SCGC AG-212-E16]|nr:hypothetical protein AYO43_00105 [Nitrospira sp. SCGC AG-212-E16]
MSRLGAVVTVGVFSMGLIMMSVLNVGHWLSAPGNMPIQGDIIVALGGGGIERVQSALKLYREGYAKRILLTGFNRTSGMASSQYLHWESRMLVDGGVPQEALFFDDHSGNSHDEANNTAVLMKTRQWKTALVISDPPHLRRLDMVWRPACAQHGLEYRLIATEPPAWNVSRWWSDKVWAKFVGMELLKLSYYTIAY